MTLSSGMVNSRWARFSLLAFALFSVLCIQAQTLISLSRNNINIKNPKFYISEIIDARSDKDLIGIVQRGISNEEEVAMFKRDFDRELSDALAPLRTPKDGRLPLIARILRLNIFEITTLNSEHAFALVTIDFYTKTEKGIKLVKSSGSSNFLKAIDVTRYHGKNIALGLEECLSDVNAIVTGDIHQFDHVPTVEYATLLTPPDVLDEYHFPIIKDSSLVKGVYKNFIEFRENDPELRIEFSMKKQSYIGGNKYDTQTGILTTNDGKERSVRGYSDGETIFIRLGWSFFPLSIEDGIYWFDGYDISNYKIKVNIRHESLLTGFLGYVYYQVKSSWTLKHSKYAINMGNGDLIQLQK